jgi:hypothetical protein
LAGALAFMGVFAFLEGGMRLAMLFAVIPALSMMLGLLRWLSIHWTLAQAYAVGGEADRAAISAVFGGLNSFLGNYVGEFLGELTLSLFFLMAATAMLARESRFPRWAGYIGVPTAIPGLVGMFGTSPMQSHQSRR